LITEFGDAKIKILALKFSSTKELNFQEKSKEKSVDFSGTQRGSFDLLLWKEVPGLHFKPKRNKF